MDFRKIFFSLTIAVVVMIAVSFLWEQVFILSFVLLTLAYLKHKCFPIKKELICFIVCGMLGSLGESIIILSSAWSYTKSQFINIPLWLPLLWGIAGTTGIVLYSGLSKSK